MKRADFIKELQQYPSEKLVYIDESGIDKLIEKRKDIHKDIEVTLPH